jgi:hypothetical protein
MAATTQPFRNQNQKKGTQTMTRYTAIIIVNQHGQPAIHTLFETSEVGLLMSEGRRLERLLSSSDIMINRAFGNKVLLLQTDDYVKAINYKISDCVEV